MPTVKDVPGGLYRFESDSGFVEDYILESRGPTGSRPENSILVESKLFRIVLRCPRRRVSAGRSDGHPVHLTHRSTLGGNVWSARCDAHRAAHADGRAVEAKVTSDTLLVLVAVADNDQRNAIVRALNYRGFSDRLPPQPWLATKGRGTEFSFITIEYKPSVLLSRRDARCRFFAPPKRTSARVRAI